MAMEKHLTAEDLEKIAVSFSLLGEAIALLSLEKASLDKKKDTGTTTAALSNLVRRIP